MPRGANIIGIYLIGFLGYWLLGKDLSLNLEAHKGIPQSEESKRKRSETIKAWWAKRRSVEDIVES